MISREEILAALTSLVSEHTNHGGSRHREGKTGGWSNTLPLLTRQTKTGNLQCTFPTAGYYTVQFGMQPPISSGSLTVVAAIATITWKVEGNTVVRKVAVNNGVSISGTGQGVTVTVEDVTPDVGQPGNLPYSVGVQISPGARPSQNQPATLIFPSQSDIAILPLGEEIFDIPSNAGVISVEIAAVGANGAVPSPANYILFFFSASKVFKTYFIPAGEYLGFVPVPPGATQMAIENESATDSLTVTPTWGIDG